MTTTTSLVPSQEQELPDSGPQNDPFNPINHLTPHLDKRNSANVAEDFTQKATAAPRLPPPSYPLTDSQATLYGDDTFGGGFLIPHKAIPGGSLILIPLKAIRFLIPPKAIPREFALGCTERGPKYIQFQKDDWKKERERLRG